MSDQNGSAGAGNPGDGAGSGEGAGAAATPWYGKDAAPEIVGFLETKGWKDNPLGPVDAYQKLESFMGADKAGRGIVLPKDLSDEAALGPIFDKLGRPAKPEEYQLPVPEGDDGALAKHFAPILHKAGLTRAQATAVAKAWNDYQASQKTDLDGKAEAAFKKAETALKLEWGDAYDKNLETARRGAKASGFTEEEIDGLETIVGYDGIMRKFHALGEKLGEDKFVLGEAGGGGAITTVEGARARLQELQKDRDWMDRWAKGDAAAKKEKDRLDAIIAGAKAA